MSKKTILSKAFKIPQGFYGTESDLHEITLNEKGKFESLECPTTAYKYYNYSPE